MAEQKRIPVEVHPGMFPSERAVSFQAGGKEYTLLVDARDVENETLRVSVVEEGDIEALIDLPRDTFSSGPRIRVPKELLQPV